MRKLCLLLGVLGMCACSVDHDELTEGQNQLQLANAIFEVEGCDVATYEFGKNGIIEVTNDETNLYITIAANEDYFLNKARLHVAADPENFPTVENGNLPPAKMELKKDFDSGAPHYTFILSLEDYGDEDGTVSIASHSIFSYLGNSYSSWAGDVKVKHGNWSYFNYDIQTCEVFEDPCDFISADLIEKTLTRSESRTLMPSIDGIRNYYISLIEEPVSRYGTLNPAASTLRLQAIAQDGLGDFISTYTVTHGECTDSVTIKITVIPDPE